MSETPVIEDRSVGFGVGEIAYLAQLSTAERAAESARWLRVEEEAHDAAMLRSGLSSLIARGYAVPGSDETVTFEPATNLVAHVLENADRWTQVDLLRDAALGDTLLLAEADGVSLLFQPRTMESWFTIPQDPAVSSAAAIAFLVRNHLADYPGGGVQIRTGRFSRPSILLVRKTDDSWTVATAVDDVVTEDPTPTADAGLEARIDVFRDGIPQ